MVTVSPINISQMRCFYVCVFFLFAACSKGNAPLQEDEVQVVIDPNAPPITWRENWFEHNQLLNRFFYNDHVAVYYDSDMGRNITWPQRISEAIWRYTWNTYGAFGDDTRLFVILHAGKYGGGHPANYFDASHDFRNVIDVGQNGSWVDSSRWNLDIVAHEIGHIVEGASKGVHNSPAFPIWHDSKWMEIYQYDVYKNLGWTEEAERWHADKLTTVDNYPRAGTQWYKNWFYPIYDAYDGSKVLNSFFTLLSRHFPTRNIAGGRQYTRNLNFGEFIHFWSGAADANLKELALAAFGDKDEQGNLWIPQFEQAQLDFSAISYE